MSNNKNMNDNKKEKEVENRDFLSHVQLEQLDDYFHTPVKTTASNKQDQKMKPTRLEVKGATAEKLDDDEDEQQFISPKQQRQLLDYEYSGPK